MDKKSLAYVPAIFLLLSAVVLAAPEKSTPTKHDACGAYPSAVLADTREKLLYLCESNRTRAKYHIAIGRKGTGKTKQGDEKTPIGLYGIGDPRPSKRFHLFIPINYPTLEQSSKGFTGGDIGIHGPIDGLSWLGRLSTSYDWTSGCIAVASNREIEAIAGWIRDKNIGRIVIK